MRCNAFGRLGQIRALPVQLQARGKNFGAFLLFYRMVEAKSLAQPFRGFKHMQTLSHPALAFILLPHEALPSFPSCCMATFRPS